MTVDNQTSMSLYLTAVIVEIKEGQCSVAHRKVPQNCKVGDEIEVFVYRDSTQDRLIATTRKPKIMLGEFTLKVVDITKVGAFWTGVWRKDLFTALPVSRLQELQKGHLVPCESLH